jgi:hypothetical protein
MFDARCDFAAIAYGADDDPDRLLLDFAADLRGSGSRVAGIIQLGRIPPAGSCELGAVVLPAAEVVSLIHDTRRMASGCRLDSGRLADLAGIVASAIADGADLVIVNRFGKLEADGRGLIDLVRRAVDADIPVLIAVPEHRFAALVKYTGGMNVRLPCRRAALDRWWRSVRSGTNGHGNADTFCEIAK